MGREKIKRILPKGLIAAPITGLFPAFFMTFGSGYKADGSGLLTTGSNYLRLLGWWILFAGLIYLLWGLADRWGRSSAGKFPSFSVKHYLLLAGIFLICWLPLYLACFPGFFTYDAGTSLIQVLYEDVPYSAHSPLIHTLLLGGIMTLVWNLTGSFNAGVCLYCLLQMLACAGVYAYTLSFLDRYCKNRTVRILALVYYAFFPVISLFAFCTTKDMLSTLLMQVFLLTSSQNHRE